MSYPPMRLPEEFPDEKTKLEKAAYKLQTKAFDFAVIMCYIKGILG